MISLGSRGAKARRAKARGAAMVEAIVIICTLLVFFGMTGFAYRAYGGKIDQMNSTRRDALYYASHSCEKANKKDLDSYTVFMLRGTNASGGSSMSVMGIISVIRGRSQFQFLGTGRSAKGPTPVVGTAIVLAGADGAVRAPLYANVKTASAVACNEKRIGNLLMYLIKQGWSAITGLFD